MHTMCVCERLSDHRRSIDGDDSRAQVTHRMQKLPVRVNHFDPIISLPHNLGVLDEVLSDDEQLTSTLHVRVTERLLCNLTQTVTYSTVMSPVNQSVRSERSLPQDNQQVGYRGWVLSRPSAPLSCPRVRSERRCDIEWISS